jgi:hypothetical protein
MRFSSVRRLVPLEVVTSVFERASERVTFAIADLDRFLQYTRFPSLVGDLPDDAHRTLVAGRPKHVAHCINLGFAQALPRAANEFEPQSPQLNSLGCRTRLTPLVPAATSGANRLTSRSTAELTL